jgi:hypothetical protein
LINSRGSHAGNNAQQIASRFSRSPQADRAKNLPSHYDLLLITGVMASSPLLNPRRDVGSMILSHLRRQVEIGGKKRGTKLGDKLFHRVTFVAKTLAAKIAVEARRVTSPVGLMPISA